MPDDFPPVGQPTVRVPDKPVTVGSITQLSSTLRAVHTQAELSRLAARVAELEAENARLREALRPFAGDTMPELADFQRAKAVLSWGE